MVARAMRVMISPLVNPHINNIANNNSNVLMICTHTPYHFHTLTNNQRRNWNNYHGYFWGWIIWWKRCCGNNNHNIFWCYTNNYNSCMDLCILRIISFFPLFFQVFDPMSIDFPFNGVRTMLKLIWNYNPIQTQTIVLQDKKNTCCLIKLSFGMKPCAYLHIVRKFKAFESV